MSFLRKFLAFSLPLFLHVGCMIETNPPDENASSSPRATPEALLKVPDDSTAGSVVPAAYDYRDPKTGTTYHINPKWHVVQRQPKALGKTSGLMQTWTDWSGQVETRIYSCQSPGPAEWQNNIGCQVEQGFTVVGGGAYVDYGSGVGALLWESRPLDGTLTTWVASSKDQIKPCAHMLTTYAIGMRLKSNSGTYISKDALTNLIMAYDKTSSPASHTPVVSLTKQDITMTPYFLGAGARANWSGAGCLLTQSKVWSDFPDNVTIFGAKDHGQSDPCTITGYAIFINNSDYPNYPQISNFGALELTTVSRAGSSVPTGVAIASRDADAEFVILGPGGESLYPSGGQGRLLFGIKPTGTYSGQISVYSKDHLYQCGGYNAVTFTEARKHH